MVLLTSKKPEPASPALTTGGPQPPVPRLNAVPRSARAPRKHDRSESSAPITGEDDEEYGDEEDDALRPGSGEDEHENEHAMWQIGDDDDDGDDMKKIREPTLPSERGAASLSLDGHHPEVGPSGSIPLGAVSQPHPRKDSEDEFGDWEDGGKVTV